MKILPSTLLVLVFSLSCIPICTSSPENATICDSHPELYGKIVNKSNGAVEKFKINTPSSISEPREISIDYPSNVTIFCKSSEPIEMNFKGEMIVIFTDVINRRFASDFYNESTSCFSSEFSFDADESATGLYSCKHIETLKNRLNPFQKNVSTYIFANNGRGEEGHLLNAGRCISTEGQIPENSQLIIPCVVSNKASSPPELYKAYEKCSSQRQTEPENFPYDPKKGFIINTSNTSDEQCWTNFMCVHGNETLFVSTIKPKEFRVTPPVSTKVYQHTITDFSDKPKLKYVKFELTCEGRRNITFQHTLPDKENVYITSSVHHTAFYKYKSVLEYNGEFTKDSNEPTGGSTFNVSCLNSDHPPKALHTWIIIYKAFNDQVGLHFNEKLESFFCYSATVVPTLPILTLIDCDNLLNCRNAEHNFHYNSNGRIFPFNISDKGYQCRTKSLWFYSGGCSEFPIAKGKAFGMAHCQTGDHHYFLMYYTTVENKIVTTVNKQSTKSSVKLTTSAGNPLYVNQTINFECEAIPIFFSLGLHLEVNETNGNNIKLIKQNKFPPNAYFEPNQETVNIEKISYSGRLTIWSKHINEIKCYAPNTFSKNVKVFSSQKLTVEEGEYPKVQANGDANVTFFEKENNKSIKCSATGKPLPKISWDKSINDVFEEQSETSENESVVTSKLLFPTMSTLFEGVYLCIATNPKGSDSIIFNVQVQDNTPLLLYLIIACSVAVLFLLLLLVLIRTLRKQKKEIEKLSEAEILEFENGNETMAKHSGELHEIAQYLPYNQEFEIPDKELELIDEDMLGSGAFGVVLKGYLEKDGEKYAVAIKTLKSTYNVSQLKKLLAEIKIMMYIGRHVNIIDLIGAQTRKLRDGKVFVIVEYCSFGNMQSFLRERRNEFIDQVFNDRIDSWITRPRTKSIKQNRNPLTKLPDSPTSILQTIQTKRISQQLPAINTLDLINWCYQLANGMEYLETKKVIHGDLATRNLLLTDNWTLKITDFGLSTHMYEYAEYIRKQKVEPLPWRWLSIEAIRDSKFSISSDVWAFGVTVWEIFTLAEMPYPGCFWGEEFVKALYKGYRMSKPQYSTNELYNIMQQCWDSDMQSRPTFKTMKEYFLTTFETCSNSNEKILEAFLGPSGFDFQCKAVQTTTSDI